MAGLRAIFGEIILPMKKYLLPASFTLALALTGAVALAQTVPPVLNPPPTAPAPAAPQELTVADPYLLGRYYRVETTQGTVFTGRLVGLSLTSLEFDAKDLGQIKLERSQIRSAVLEGPAPASVQPGKSGYYDIGNGNRLFFAPTGRGLRQGEGTLQDIDVYLMGVNYGITDNISLGGYLSVVPGLDIDDQLLVFTPKLSFPLNDKVHFGAGLLYVRVPTGDATSVGAGIGYGALTYGSADDNFTVGLGYAFVQGDIGSTPIVQIGGQTRVSRRVSLISENYIVADAKAGMGGLYGLKLNWRRTSLGLGAAYFYAFSYDDSNYGYTSSQGGYGFTTYVVPVYADFTFRFGQGAKK
ncbi:MAG: hypothetical protein JWR44_2382 [Hymenobacter sp.]|jgi:hypothetical protein|nr:hypothetical protein [Hymenobacter sp.]